MESLRFFNPRAAIDIHRRNLPHWQQTGVPVFVTWRWHPLYSEDLNHGQKYECVRVVNPFVEGQ